MIKINKDLDSEIKIFLIYTFNNWIFVHFMNRQMKNDYISNKQSMNNRFKSFYLYSEQGLRFNLVHFLFKLYYLIYIMLKT